MCVGLWCLTAVFASAKRMRKLTANAIGGKPVGRGRWRTHNLVTGANGLSATGTNLRIAPPPYQPRSELWRVCGWNKVEDTVSPLTALGRFGRLGAKRKGFQVWRGSSGQSLNTSAIADTLLTEAFLEAGGSSDCLKKVWRTPAAVLLRRQSAQGRTLPSSD